MDPPPAPAIHEDHPTMVTCFGSLQHASSTGPALLITGLRTEASVSHTVVDGARSFTLLLSSAPILTFRTMDAQIAREMALDMPGTAEKEHFGRPSYSVKKKIYMTLWLDDHRAVMKLTPEQQASFHEEHPDAFAPVPNKWGQHGWTNVFMAHCPDRLFRYAMDLAWRNVAPKWIIPTRPAPPRG